MIQPGELRVGNLVNILSLANPVMIPIGTMRISEIKFGYVTEIKVDQPNELSLRYERIDPIPLTEELLLKFGFEESETYDFGIRQGKVPIFLLNDLTLIFSDNIYWYSTKVYDGGTAEEYQPMVEVKSVHHLQNLYFALTGEELTIK